MGQLLVSRRGDGDDPEVAGVERGGDAADGAPLAGSIPAFEDRDGGDVAFAGEALGFVEAALLTFEIDEGAVSGNRFS